MREIKFRGKRTDGEGWFYGGFAVVESRPTIFANVECREVYPETVGQYTGLRDKNCKEIYEGDVIQTYTGGFKHSVCDIRYLGREFCMAYDGAESEMDCIWYCDFEVIGNIHDNSPV